MGTWTSQRVQALDAVATLMDLLADNSAGERRLITAYLEAKQALADAFEALAVERYSDPSVLESAKQVIEEAMRYFYPELPAKYLKVRGFGQAHALLLAYLASRTGTEISAAELRMLTGDAVHTERRARELRDLGFELEARHTGGIDTYVLHSPAPNAAAAAAVQVAKNIKQDKMLEQGEAAALLSKAGLQYAGC